MKEKTMHGTVVNNISAGEIALSKIHGHGLFANQDIPVGCTLASLDGQEVPWALYKLTKKEESDAFNEWNAINPTLLLVRTFRTKYSFINHSRSPNCKVNAYSGKVIVSTMSNIPAGEELTLDYRHEPLPEEYLSGHGSTYL